MSNRQTLKESELPDKEAGSKNGEAPRSYYYDDSTGYETNDDEADRDEEEGCEGESPDTER
ncbi:MAG TPA: hypothetical protein VLQ90_10275 [Pyrinomonadaceae bacterium]|nr:hypothetical protein [Pyrinomonadaceae bacterium]